MVPRHIVSLDSPSSRFTKHQALSLTMVTPSPPSLGGAEV